MTETHNIEYKESWHDEYLKWVAAYANAEGGILYIGKNDKGATVGLRKVKKLMEDIPNKIKNILGITAKVTQLDDGGLDFIEIEVKPCTAPISYMGEFYYRSGASKHALSGISLTQFLLEKTGSTWDETVIDDVDVDDLGDKGFAIFKASAIKNGKMKDVDLACSNFELLEKLGLAINGKLTYAAVLLFHPDPEKWVFGAYAKIGFFEGPEIRYQDEVHGSLFEQAEGIVDILFTKYFKAWVTYNDLIRVENYPFPRGGIREAVYNCLIHKLYPAKVPIQIKVYEDEAFFFNDARLPEGLTADALMKRHGSYPINPLVANAFFGRVMLKDGAGELKRLPPSASATAYPFPTMHSLPIASP